MLIELVGDYTSFNGVMNHKFIVVHDFVSAAWKLFDKMAMQIDPKLCK